MGILENLKVIRGNTVAGIHLQIQTDGRWLMNIMVLKNRKGLIRISQNYTGISTLEEIVQLLAANLPVVLSIEGKGVIHKKSNHSDSVHLVQQVFPNAQSEDFFVQSNEISNNLRIISLIRRNTVIEIMGEFMRKGYRILNLFLGPFSLNGLWAFFDQPQKCYRIANYLIQTEQTGIIDLSIQTENIDDEPFSIAGESVCQELLIPYANAVFFLLNGDHGLFYNEDICSSNREQFIYKRLFQASALGLLGFLFVVLLINFLLFDKFSREYLRAKIQFRDGIALVNRMDSLQTELSYKQDIVEENRLSQGSRFSLYADKIAAIVPEQIALTKLEINPALSKPSADKELQFNRDRVEIKGKCTSGYVLDEWLEKLKHEPWIKHIEVLQYTQENKGTPGEFVIQIEY
jgi:Tfp pilus assembly protein PilN